MTDKTLSSKRTVSVPPDLDAQVENAATALSTTYSGVVQSACAGMLVGVMPLSFKRVIRPGTDAQRIGYTMQYPNGIIVLYFADMDGVYRALHVYTLDEFTRQFVIYDNLIYPIDKIPEDAEPFPIVAYFTYLAPYLG